MELKYEVYVLGVLVAVVKAPKGWSKEHHTTSEDEFKNKYVSVERNTDISRVFQLELKV
jgi:hypothetical protein